MDHETFWSLVFYRPREVFAMLEQFLCSTPRYYQEKSFETHYYLNPKVSKLQNELYRVVFIVLRRLACCHTDLETEPDHTVRDIKAAFRMMHDTSHAAPFFTPARVIDMCAVYPKKELQELFEDVTAALPELVPAVVDILDEKTAQLGDDMPDAFRGLRARFGIEEKLALITDLAFDVRCFTRVFPATLRVLCDRSLPAALARLYDRQILRSCLSVLSQKKMGFLASSWRTFTTTLTMLLKCVRYLIKSRYLMVVETGQTDGDLSGSQALDAYVALLRTLSELPVFFLAYYSNFSVENDLSILRQCRTWMTPNDVNVLCTELKSRADYLLMPDEGDILDLETEVEQDYKPVGSLATGIENVRSAIPALKHARTKLIEECLRCYNYSDRELVSRLQRGDVSRTVERILVQDKLSIESIVEDFKREEKLFLETAARHEALISASPKRNPAAMCAAACLCVSANREDLGEWDDTYLSMFGILPDLSEELSERKRLLLAEQRCRERDLKNGLNRGCFGFQDHGVKSEPSQIHSPQVIANKAPQTSDGSGRESNPSKINPLANSVHSQISNSIAPLAQPKRKTDDVPAPVVSDDSSVQNCSIRFAPMDEPEWPTLSSQSLPDLPLKISDIRGYLNPLVAGRPVPDPSLSTSGAVPCLRFPDSSGPRLLNETHERQLGDSSLEAQLPAPGKPCFSEIASLLRQYARTPVTSAPSLQTISQPSPNGINVSSHFVFQQASSQQDPPRVPDCPGSSSERKPKPGGIGRGRFSSGSSTASSLHVDVAGLPAFVPAQHLYVPGSLCHSELPRGIGRGRGRPRA